MATMEDEERPASALDNMTRLNLLDVVLERSRNFNKKALIHSLVYVGRLNPERRQPQELAEYYELLFKSFSGHLQVESASGLLLIYPNHFIHIVEGPENVLLRIMQGFSDNSHENNVIGESKLLVFINEIPVRLFSQWSYRILNLASVRMDESKQQDSIENKISEAITLVLKLAKELGKFTKLQLKANLDQLTTKFSNLLLPQDLIEALIKSKELSTIAEYYKRYTAPMEITLDSELVWPMKTNLAYL